MAKESFHYLDKDRGSLYSAALKAVADQGMKLKFTDRAGGVISCNSKWSMKSFGQQINLTIVTGSPGATLTISTICGQAYDWGEGKSLIRKLKGSLDANFEVMVNEEAADLSSSVTAPSADVVKEGKAQALSLRESNILRQKSSRTHLFWLSLVGVATGAASIYFRPDSFAALWPLGLGACGLAAWYVWGMFVPKQCVSCGKHTVRCMSSIDTLIAVRSEQRSVTNLNTRQAEWARVTVSDMENRSTYRCMSCKHDWIEVQQYKKDGG
ncbi:hypothetical protein J2Y86_000226 [Pseudomonas migulae]|uniref:hypothetical protein n=1 Tax=Pseudomonas migulae TaxID=78543 RepID=UPI00209EF662|nr:hypothetical protein [Pseudomonas migulae]MCP1495519.1 hypothetical protein [Pseudomonas migulae]